MCVARGVVVCYECACVREHLCTLSLRFLSTTMIYREAIAYDDDDDDDGLASERASERDTVVSTTIMSYMVFRLWHRKNVKKFIRAHSSRARVNRNSDVWPTIYIYRYDK